MLKKQFRCIFAIIFTVIGLFLYSGISEIMRLKQGGKHADLIHSFYDIKKDSLDVLVFGSSLSYYGIQPNVFWHEYGFAACDISSPSQSIPTTYYLLKEALRYQHPKVVVLESYAIWNDQKYYTPDRLHAAIDAVPLSTVKIEAIEDLCSDMSLQEKMPFYIPFLIYHNRWKDLTADDFHTESFMKGSVFNTNVFENDEVFLPDEKAPVPEIVTEYFEKIESLCREKGIELFVVQMPIGKYMGEDWPTFTNDLLKMANTFFDYLDTKGIPYKFYQKTKELGINWKTDYADSTHLNAFGALKASKNLGAYLKETYDLPDHRSEKKYSQWNTDSERFYSLLDEAEKKREE